MLTFTLNMSDTEVAAAIVRMQNNIVDVFYGEEVIRGRLHGISGATVLIDAARVSKNGFWWSAPEQRACLKDAACLGIRAAQHDVRHFHPERKIESATLAA